MLWILQEIRRVRRENLSKEARRTLMKEDDREERELRGYVMANLAHQISQSMPGAVRPEDAKIREERAALEAELIARRAEGGYHPPDRRDGDAR